MNKNNLKFYIKKLLIKIVINNKQNSQINILKSNFYNDQNHLLHI